MSSRRAPAGLCSGALAGQYPDEVALGLPLLMGLHWHDDFAAVHDLTEGRYGEMAWKLTTTGTGQWVQSGASAWQQHEYGIGRLQVTASGDKAVLHQDISYELFNGSPPIGTIWSVKIRHNSSTTNATLWLGFAEDADIPGSGVSTRFVGVRNQGSANWYGVCRNGVAETVRDLGVAGSTSTSYYRVLGFMRTTRGFEFFRADCTDRETPPHITWVDPISTYIPSTSYDLTPVIGLQSTDTGTKGMVFDWFEIGGRIRRN